MLDIPSINLNIISCFSALCGINIKLKAVEKYAMDSQEFNIINYALKFIQTTLDVKPDVEIKNTFKEENQLRNAIFFECLVLFSKIPKNYLENLE